MLVLERTEVVECGVDLSMTVFFTSGGEEGGCEQILPLQYTRSSRLENPSQILAGRRGVYLFFLPEFGSLI